MMDTNNKQTVAGSFVVRSDSEILSEGLVWLSNNIAYRDEIFGKKNRSQRCVIWNSYYIKAKKRSIDYIKKDTKGLQWLHDFLLSVRLHPDLFEIFFIIWSSEYRTLYVKNRI